MTPPHATAPAPGHASASLSFHRRAMAFGFGVAFASCAGQSFFIGLFGPAMQATLGLSSARWGALYGAATLVSGLAMFWLGGLVDRVHPTRAAGLVLCLLALGAGLMAGSQGTAMLLVALLCLRLGGQGLAGHLAIVTAARHALKRGRSIAVAAFGFIAGEAALPLLLTALLASFDWRWIWAGVALLLLGLGWPGLHRLAAPLPRASDATLQTSLASGLRRRDLLRNPRFLATLAVVMAPPFVVTAVFVQQGSLAALRQWQPAWVALAFVCFAAAQAFTTWIAGRWVDKHGAQGLLRIYLWPMAGGAALLMLAPTAAPQVTLWGLFAGMGATSGAQSVLSGALWAELFGIERLGLVRGVYAAIMVLTTAAAPAALGAALDAGWPLAALAAAVMAHALLVPLIVQRALANKRP